MISKWVRRAAVPFVAGTIMTPSAAWVGLATSGPYVESSTVYGAGHSERIVLGTNVVHRDCIDDDSFILLFHAMMNPIKAGPTTYDVWLEGTTDTFTDADIQWFPDYKAFGVAVNIRAPSTNYNGLATLQVKATPTNGMECVETVELWFNARSTGALYRDRHANAYWVDPAIGSDAFPGTEAQPFATLNFALNLMSAGARDGAYCYVRGTINQDTGTTQVVNAYPVRILPWPGFSTGSVSIGCSIRTANSGLFCPAAARTEFYSVQVRQDDIHNILLGSATNRSVYLNRVEWTGSPLGKIDAFGLREGFPHTIGGTTSQDYVRSSSGQVNMMRMCTGTVWLVGGFRKILGCDLTFGWDALYYGRINGIGPNTISIMGLRAYQPELSTQRLHVASYLEVDTITPVGGGWNITFIGSPALVALTLDVRWQIVGGPNNGEIHGRYGNTNGNTTTTSVLFVNNLVPNAAAQIAKIASGSFIRVFVIPHNDARQFAIIAPRTDPSMRRMYCQGLVCIAENIQHMLMQVGDFRVVSAAANTTGATLTFTAGNRHCITGDSARVDTGPQAGEIRTVSAGQANTVVPTTTTGSVTLASAFSADQTGQTITTGLLVNTVGTTLTVGATTYMRTGLVIHINEGTERYEYAMVIAGSGTTWTLSNAFTNNQVNKFASVGHALLDSVFINYLGDKLGILTDDMAQIQNGMWNVTFINETYIGNNGPSFSGFDPAQTASLNYVAPGNGFSFRSSNAGFGLHEVMYLQCLFEVMTNDAATVFPPDGLTIDQCNFELGTARGTNSQQVDPLFTVAKRGSPTSGYLPDSAVRQRGTSYVPFDVFGSPTSGTSPIGAVVA